MIYKIEDIDGNKYETVDLNEFCEERELTKRLLDYTKPKWKDSGKRYQEYHKRFKIVEEIIEVQGTEERKAKYDELEDGYLVYGSKTNIKISKDDLRKIKKLYCVDRLTINKTSLEMDLLREELTLVLNAFSINHDDVPYINEDIDELSVDDMAENTRIEKKRAYYRKLEGKKYADIEKQVKKFMEKDYLFDKMSEKIKSMTPNYISKEFSQVDDDKYHTFFITDEHAGLEINSHFNEYNLEIMKDKFETLTNEILNSVENGHIDLLFGGDSVHGISHQANEKNGDFVTKSFEVLVQCYVDMIATLSRTGKYKIRLAKANGSHESLKSLKTSRTDEENFGKLVWFALKLKFADFDDIELIEPLKNSPFTVIPYYNYSRMIGHGDEMSMENYVKFSQQLNKNVLYVDVAHFHHYKSEERYGIRVTYNECLCGSDQYAQKLGLFSNSGVRYSIYNKDGMQETKLIRL